MAQKCVVAVILVAAMLCVSNCSGNNTEMAKAMDSTTIGATVADTTNESTALNQTEIMLKCNETFHTSMG